MTNDRHSAPLTPPVTVAATDQAGEVERAAVAIAKVLGIDLHEHCAAKSEGSCDSGTCPGALTEDHDTDEHRERIYRMARAALATQPATGRTMGGEETWASIAQWCEETFGPCTPYRMATRAGEELAELTEEAQALSWSDKARIEAADVLICLSRVPRIWEAVEEKMAINRARKWNVQGDGTGYHVRAALQNGGE